MLLHSCIFENMALCEHTCEILLITGRMCETSGDENVTTKLYEFDYKWRRANVSLERGYRMYCRGSLDFDNSPLNDNVHHKYVSNIQASFSFIYFSFNLKILNPYKTISSQRYITLRSHLRV